MTKLTLILFSFLATTSVIGQLDIKIISYQEPISDAPNSGDREVLDTQEYTCDTCSNKIIIDKKNSSIQIMGHIFEGRTYEYESIEDNEEYIELKSVSEEEGEVYIFKITKDEDKTVLKHTVMGDDDNYRIYVELDASGKGLSTEFKN